MRVFRWGNDMAICLPAAVVETLALQEGDDVTVFAFYECEAAIPRQCDRSELLNRLRAFRGRLSIDFRFDRDKANNR